MEEKTLTVNSTAIETLEIMCAKFGYLMTELDEPYRMGLLTSIVSVQDAIIGLMKEQK